MRCIINLLFQIVITILCIMGANKLEAQSTQNQILPEVDAYYRINNRFRLYGLISGIGANSENTDGTAGVYVDYFARLWERAKKNQTEMNDSVRGYNWWLRGGYSYSQAPSYEKKKDVNIFETELNNIFRLPCKTVMIFRNRLDWRWVNGDFLPVYRLRLKFVRNFKTEYLNFNLYTWGEYFFYLNNDAQDKFRLCFGAVIKVLNSLSFEVYYRYQFPNGLLVPAVNAIGIQFNLYFSSKHYSG